jgi:hypothetical protein
LLLKTHFRIKERRTAYSDDEEDYGIFHKTNKTAIAKIIVEIIERISAENITIDEPESACSASTLAAQVVAAIPILMKEKLQLAIKKKNRCYFESLDQKFQKFCKPSLTRNHLLRTLFKNFQFFTEYPVF